MSEEVSKTFSAHDGGVLQDRLSLYRTWLFITTATNAAEKEGYFYE
jgi:hypothetical protein